MKWAVKDQPKLYDYREVEKFAWLPTRAVAYAGDGSHTSYIIWLEYYIDYQQYRTMMNGDGEPVDMWDSRSNNVILKGMK